MAQLRSVEKLGEKRSLTVSRPGVLVDGSDETFRQVVHNLLALSSRLQDVNAGYAAIVGVTPVQYSILSVIFQKQSDQTLTITKVAEHLHLSGSFVTIETGKLVKAGLVSKKVDESDRRRVNLTTTPKAEARFRLLNGFQCPVNNAVFERISSREFLNLAAIVEKLLPDADRALHLLADLIPLADAVDRGSVKDD